MVLSSTASVAGRVTAKDLAKPTAFAALEGEISELRKLGDYEAAAAVQHRLEVMKREADALNQQVRGPAKMWQDVSMSSGSSGVASDCQLLICIKLCFRQFKLMSWVLHGV